MRFHSAHVDPGKQKKRLDVEENSFGKTEKIFIGSLTGYGKKSSSYTINVWRREGGARKEEFG